MQSDIEDKDYIIKDLRKVLAEHEIDQFSLTKNSRKEEYDEEYNFIRKLNVNNEIYNTIKNKNEESKENETRLY